ncbi:MAG: hypothetical protein HY926_10215, partial [Elusimicrobia bacterium]|nr:hypothetical protein [Elusimicrobiota bacterium]
PETFDQGSVTNGKTGTPAQQTAGQAALVTVGIVDSYFNLVPGVAADVETLPSDNFAPHVDTAPINIVTGKTAQFSVTLLHAATGHFLRARDYTGASGLTDDVSSTFTVRAAPPVGFQLVLPGQTVVGGAGDYFNGQYWYNRAAATPTAGVPFTIAVNLVDRYLNLSTLVGAASIYFTASDSYALLPDTQTMNLQSGIVSAPATFYAKAPDATLRAWLKDPGISPCTGNSTDSQSPIFPSATCLMGGAASQPFKVYAAAPAALQAVLPWETEVPGSGGKAPIPGYTPDYYTIGQGSPLNVRVDLIDAHGNVATDCLGVALNGCDQDTDPPSAMPQVGLSLPSDPLQTVLPSPQVLTHGQATFAVTPLTALSTYTVAASTVLPSVSYSSVTSAQFKVYPGPLHHMHFTDVALGSPYLTTVNANAGEPFGVGLVVHDQFHNRISTGPNLYIGTAKFSGESFSGAPWYNPNWSTSFSSASVTFTALDAGQMSLPGLVTLNKAGTCPVGGAAGGRWIKAFDSINGNANTEWTPFSLQPCFTVSPGSPYAVKVTPTFDTPVGAGTLGQPGFQIFTGQLTDAQDNPITNPRTLEVEIYGVYGATGTISWQSGGGSWVNAGASTQVVTDASGQVGIASALRYNVSTRAGDFARIWVGTNTVAGTDPGTITNLLQKKMSFSGKLTTVGGTSSKIQFASLQAAATVGLNADPGAGAQFAVQRYDDFNNLTTQGDDFIDLSVLEIGVHDFDNRHLCQYGNGSPGNPCDYGFRDIGNIAFMSGYPIYANFSGIETPFLYYDRMSSYSGPDADSNTGERTRPGRWTIQASLSGKAFTVQTQLAMHPGAPSKVDFGNSVNTETAGRPLRAGSPTYTLFTAQLQDQFSNPVVATQPYTVQLATVTRVASGYNDYVAFSTGAVYAAGSRAMPPVLATTTRTVTIPVLAYGATFYYVDTTASNRYAADGTTRPVISLACPPLQGSEQGVIIAPDSIDRIAITTGAGMGLLAGTTSAMPAGSANYAPFFLETRDYYGNASPWPSGSLDFVAFNITSNSPGQVQISTPDVGAFKTAPADFFTPVAYIKVGQSATSFYLIDTMVSPATWQLTVKGVTYPTWEAAVSSYSVAPGPPAGIRFTTPPRRLIAGTTIQFYPDYQTGVPTGTWVAASLVDQFNNVTKPTGTAPSESYTIKYQAADYTAWGAYVPLFDDVIIATQPSSSWQRIGCDPFTYICSNIPVNVPSAGGPAPFFLFDTNAGTVTITAQAYTNCSVVCAPVFPMAAQDQLITPDRATYLSIHHPYDQQKPLPVGDQGSLKLQVGPDLVGITARDAFGNIARGDPVNGQYYTSRVIYGHSGSSTAVTIGDLTAGTTYHDFTGSPTCGPSCDYGSYNNLGVRDMVREDLVISATDYYNPPIWGASNDHFYRSDLWSEVRNNLNKVSTGPVYTAGVVVFPADLAPESNPPPNGPIPQAKLALGITEYGNGKVLNQGDGTTPGSPDPIPMLRLAVNMGPTTVPPLQASMKSLRVGSQSGFPKVLDNSHVSELALYADSNGNIKFDPITGVPGEGDTLVAIGTYAAGAWHFGNDVEKLSLLDPVHCANLGAAPRYFFITVRISSSGYGLTELPAGFGLTIPNRSDLALDDGYQAGVAENYFPIRTSTSSVEREGATIRVNDAPAVYDINAWWQPSGAPQLSSFNYVTQGQVNVGVFKLDMWTDVFSAVLSSIKVTHSGGTGLTTDITRVRLFEDVEAGVPPGDGKLQPLADKQLAEATFPLGQRFTYLTLSDPYVDGLITGATHSYFVAVDFSPSAQADQTHGFTIMGSDIIPANGNSPQIAPLIAHPITMEATPDTVIVSAVNSNGSCPSPADPVCQEAASVLQYAASSVLTSSPSIPTKLTQNSDNQPVMKLSLRVPSGSAEWKGLKLDRWMASTWNSGSGQYNVLFSLNNKASDVEKIRVWRDSNDDGFLEPSVDGQVSGVVTHNFPTTQLAVALASGTPGVDISTTDYIYDVAVTDILGMFPNDDPFRIDLAPENPDGDNINRLVLGDDQIDESKKEVVVCTGRDMAGKRFTGCARGQEGTAPLIFSTGAVLSGSARLPIIDLLGGGGGQILGEQIQNYFITYDVAPLATVAPSIYNAFNANLGVVIGGRQVWLGGGAGLMQANTHYFQITPPKKMGTARVGVPVIVMGGDTVSLVPEVAHVADKLLVISTDAVDSSMGPSGWQNIGAFAQQTSTLPMANLTVQTGIADAEWRWLLVFATGTATAGGDIAADVDQVSLWYDANGDSVFDAPDVLVGTGTFGNYGGQLLVAQIKISPYRNIITADQAPQPQRFFVAYHMTATAQPVDALGQPRTVGVQLLPPSAGLGSLPAGFQPDLPALNSLSYPNVYDPASPLPFTSKPRAIVAAPQTVYVKSTPYFSNSSGTFPSPLLAGVADIPAAAAGSTDLCWMITSTVGLPVPTLGATSYLMLDGEIVAYGGLGILAGGNCSNDPGGNGAAILQVRRGLLNTVGSTHTVGVPLGTPIQQGERNLALMKLEMWSSAFQVQWSGLQLSRVLPSGLSGDDTDIDRVHVYKSVTPDRSFHRIPATGEDAGDPEMGSAPMGQPPDTPGRVTVPISDPGIFSPGFALITPTTSVFYVAADVSPKAKFSYPESDEKPPRFNEVFGANAALPLSFQITPVNAGHQTVLVSTVASPNYPITPTLNPVTVDIMDERAGAPAQQNEENVKMAQLRLRTSQNSAILTRIKLDRVGDFGALDSDINLVKVWQAPACAGQPSCFMDASVTTRTPSGTYPNLLSYGNETFSSGTVTILLRTPVVVTTTPAYYFITYDVSQFASEGSRFGLSIPDPLTYLTMQAPNTVVPGTPGFVSQPYIPVQKVTSQLTLGVNDLAQNIPGVGQAQQNVAMLRFNLATDIALAPVRSMRLERTGGSPQDPTRPMGRNTDVKFVRVYKDINQNDVLDGADINLSEVATSLVGGVPYDGIGFSSVVYSTAGFAVGPTSSTFVGFNLVVVSTAGFPVDVGGDQLAGRLFVNNAELMTFSSAPGCQFPPQAGFFEAPAGSGVFYPCLTVISRANRLGQTQTPLLNVPGGAAVKKVDVFNQENDADVQTVVTFSNDQFVSPTAGSFFVAYDVGDAAVANNLIGVAVRAPSWFGMPRGDQVMPEVRMNVTRTQPLGTYTTGYPFVGMNVAVSPITLSVYGLTIAPAGAGLGAQNVALMQMQLNTNTNFADIAKLRLAQTAVDARGQTEVSASTTSYLDFSRLSVWLDNGSGVFNPAISTLLGSAAMPAAPPSPGTPNYVTVPLSVAGIPYLHVTTATTILYIAADIGTSTSTLGDRSGVKLNAFVDILASNGAPVSAAADPVKQPPFESSKVTIQSLSVPAVAISSTGIPVIVTRAQTGVPGGAVGFPAYAEIDAANCNNGGDVNNLRNDICRDSGGNPIPDQRRWICANGTPGVPAASWCAAAVVGGHWRCQTFNCPADPPLIDINGDGIADNFMVGESTRATFVSLTGDGLPARDLTGTGILEMDLNQDGIVDMVFTNAYGGIQIMLGNDITDQGNAN